MNPWDGEDEIIRNLILKELQDLKFRVEGLENKNKENSRNDNRDKREEYANRHRNGEDDIIRKIKIDPLTFDGVFDPKIFSDWMAYLDYYFDWYRFTEKARIQFARMRLQGQVGLLELGRENT